MTGILPSLSLLSQQTKRLYVPILEKIINVPREANTDKIKPRNSSASLDIYFFISYQIRVKELNVETSVAIAILNKQKVGFWFLIDLKI